MRTQSNFRLLVVRLGAMGDILHALPAVTALRLAHPGWQIDWVVEPRWQALLKAGTVGLRDIGTTEGDSQIGPAQPLINRLHFAPTKQWRRRLLGLQTFAEIRSLRRELRACRYDAVIDPQGAIRSAVIAHMSGSARRIGDDNPRERPAKLLYTECLVTRGAHVIDRAVELASSVACDTLAAARPLLPVDAEAEGWCRNLIADDNRPIVLLSPGGGWGAKCWPAERYKAVAHDLALRGFRIFVNFGPGELALAQAVCSSGVAQAIAPSLSELIALTRRIALCIAGDTGPLHLACALGRPVVGIYGPTDPSRNGPYGTRSRVLRSPQSLHNYSHHELTEAGLLTIEPADVLRAAGELMIEVEAASGSDGEEISR